MTHNKLKKGENKRNGYNKERHIYSDIFKVSLTHFHSLTNIMLVS